MLPTENDFPFILGADNYSAELRQQRRWRRRQMMAMVMVGQCCLEWSICNEWPIVISNNMFSQWIFAFFGVPFLL